MGNFLDAEWRKLVMINYSVKPSLLQPLVPKFTELDTWNGICFISLVGFMFQNTQLKGIKIPFHVNFEEVNLRFYVRYTDANNDPKRGVVFIKEVVPKTMISLVANTLYRENYSTMPMKHSWEITEDELKIDYSLKKNNTWHTFGVTAYNDPQELVTGSEAEFITEHFWGYAKWNDQLTNEYEVGHPRWKIYPVTGSQVNLNNAKPVSVYLAEGSEIFVRKGRRINK